VIYINSLKTSAFVGEFYQCQIRAYFACKRGFIHAQVFVSILDTKDAWDEVEVRFLFVTHGRYSVALMGSS